MAWDAADVLHDRHVYAHGLRACALVAFEHALRDLTDAERAMMRAVKRADRARDRIHRAASVVEDAARLLARAIDEQKS